MGTNKKKSGILKLSSFLTGYSLGLLAWVMGLHCVEENAQGILTLSTPKLVKHLFKLFLWTLEVILLCQLFGWYRGWLLQASGPEVATAFLVKSVIFLYVKVFWPRVFPEILPGLHVFFCPQCYQKQTFRFQPVSFQFGFFVTYLCRYCSCLVDGWGRQIFYPMPFSFGKITLPLAKLVGPVLLTLFFAARASIKILGMF